MTGYRYSFEKKGSQHTCPLHFGGCGQRRKYTRYVDTSTGELLPENYGICNRKDNCGYYSSPYHPTNTGLSFVEEVYRQETNNYNKSKSYKKSILTPSINPSNKNPEPKRQEIFSIPEHLFYSSLARYKQNNFVKSLSTHFGLGIAEELISRFHLGTSSFWPGAATFWLIDEQQKIRGGQVVLFNEFGHTVKHKQKNGSTFRCTLPVHFALLKKYKKLQLPVPAWLEIYIEHAPKWPIPFGLHQLAMAPKNKPLAIVEAPATAIFCTPYSPEFIWLAIGSLSYLNAERLLSLKDRSIFLFPDLSATGNAYKHWCQQKEQLYQRGYSVNISDFLEQKATQLQRSRGYDLRDYFLEQWPGYPVSWDLI